MQGGSGESTQDYIAGATAALAFAKWFGLRFPPPDDPPGPSPTFPTAIGDIQVQAPLEGNALVFPAEEEWTPNVFVLARFEKEQRSVCFFGWQRGNTLRATRPERRRGRLVHVLPRDELRPMEELEALFCVAGAANRKAN